MSVNIENAKVHLVLGSGGARGIAHIGVINELEKRNCKIVSVSGCSMGAVVGGIYCTGKLPLFAEWLLSITKRDVFSLMDFTFSTAGLIKGKKILHVIEEFIGTHNIEDLKIPFTAIATDLYKREEVHYTKGNLYKAIRASIGIPSLFTPMIEHDKLLIDGGILNPLPISAIKKKDEDEIIVAVNLCDKRKKSPFPMKKNEPFMNKDYFGIHIQNLFSDWLKKEDAEPELEEPNVISILTHTIDLMQDKVTEQTIKHYKPEILVNIRRDFAKTMDFHLAGELMEEGVSAFHKAIKNN